MQYLWERMRGSGYIYKGSYDGWYCVHEETSLPETQVEKADEEQGTKRTASMPRLPSSLERVTEESWFFKLSSFQDRLLKLYEEHRVLSLIFVSMRFVPLWVGTSGTYPFLVQALTGEFPFPL